MSFLKNAITGKDNETIDIGRIAISMVIMLFPLILIWGLFMFTWAFFHHRTLDLQIPFNAFSIFISAFGAFMITGAGSLWIKRDTEPSEKTKEGEKKDKLDNQS